MKGPTSDEQRLVLFENRWLEKLTVVSVRWFVVTWAIVIPFVSWSGWGTASPIPAAALTVAGWLIWSLFEYFAHRKLFHMEPKSLFLQRIIFLIHGNHHAQPRDELRNLMPPTVSLPVGGIVWSLFLLATGSAGTWLFLGFVCGYVAYDLTHYATHHWQLRGPLGRRLKRHHMQHHFLEAHKNYGVTTTFWDTFFGTRFEARRVSPPAKQITEEALEPAE